MGWNGCNSQTISAGQMDLSNLFGLLCPARFNE